MRAELIIGCDQIDKDFSKGDFSREQERPHKLTGALADAPPGVADIVCVSDGVALKLSALERLSVSAAKGFDVEVEREVGGTLAR